MSGEPDTAVASGSARLFWAQVAGNAGLLTALVLVTRALGPEGRGTVAFLTVTAMVVAQIARVGITEATTVFAAQRPEARDVLLGNALIAVAATGVGSALIVCGTLWALPSIRPPGVGHVELWLLGAGLLASAVTDAGYMFTLGCSRFRFHAGVTIVTAWLYAGIVALVWALHGLTVDLAMGCWVAVQALKAIVLVTSAGRRCGIARPQRALLVESALFGLRAWVGSLSTAFNDRLDQVLVAIIASEATLGVYAVAVNAAEILLYLPASAATVMLPLVARSQPAERVRRTVAAFRSVMLLTVGGTLLAAAAGPELLPLVFGDAFEASVAPFLLLLPGALGFGAMAIFSNALVASGVPGRGSAGPTVSLGASIALDLLLIPSLGARGAAIASSAALIGGGATALALYRRGHPFPLRALVLPRREDLLLVAALRRPFARSSSAAPKDSAA
jgi:O-antigen/teichoic acid export membrane protein